MTVQVDEDTKRIQELLSKGEYQAIFDQYAPVLQDMLFVQSLEEWLDFIVSCRLGNPHEYDIVEGPMANDTIFNFVQSFSDGEITREAFWALAKFKKPTHQISFHTARALATLTFLKGEPIHGEA